MIYHCQYLAEEYPLHEFSISDIPDLVSQSAAELSARTGAFIRGGLCYYLHTHDDSYLLKDIDMIAFESVQEQALHILHKSSNEIYVNHNHAMKTVITAFWPTENHYFKLDLLLSEKMPPPVEILWNNKNLMCVSLDYILIDRLSKIAERKNRAHSIEKTLNHYSVVNKIADFMLQSCSFHLQASQDIFCELVHRAQSQLIQIVGQDEADAFLKKQLQLLHRG